MSRFELRVVVVDAGRKRGSILPTCIREGRPYDYHKLYAHKLQTCARCSVPDTYPSVLAHCVELWSLKLAQNAGKGYEPVMVQEAVISKILRSCAMRIQTAL